MYPGDNENSKGIKGEWKRFFIFPVQKEEKKESYYDRAMKSVNMVLPKSKKNKHAWKQMYPLCTRHLEYTNLINDNISRQKFKQMGTYSEYQERP